MPLVLAWFAFAAVASDDRDTKLIDAYVSGQAHRERGEEYTEARKVVTGALNHDGIPDTAVLYTIEGQRGSNRSVQYLTVFVRSNGKLIAAARVEVGSNGDRFVDLKSIENNTIHFETLGNGPEDPACCPSEKGESDYALAGNALKEHRKPPVGGWSVSGDR
jgi:hypothetical protein